jgi:BASS family bile acid:Na+ symporter
VRSFEIKGKRTVETTSFSNFLGTVGALGTLIFVITSLLGMCFSLTVQQILAPLSNRKLVIFSLAANFILVPLLTLGVLFIFPPSEGLSIRLFLLGTSAGAPFLPKLHGGKRGHCFFSRAYGAPDDGDYSLRADSPAALALKGLQSTTWI